MIKKKKIEEQKNGMEGVFFNTPIFSQKIDNSMLVYVFV